MGRGSKLPCKRKIHFPRPCTPVEVYDGKAIGRQVMQVEVDLDMGQIIMLQMT